MAAGLLTKTNDISYVAPFNSQQARVSITGYNIGALSVNKNAVTNVVAINSFYDPVNTRTATEALINSGVDVIGGDMDDPTKVAVANEHPGVWGIGATTSCKCRLVPITT